MTELRFPRRTYRLLALSILAPLALVSCADRAATTTFEVVETSILDLQRGMEDGTITAVGLVEAYLSRIAAYDRSGPRLNAMIRLNPNALEEASALDEERASGSVRGALHGIPILLKDNYDIVGIPTTGSSLALANLLPPDDGFQVERLKAAGAIVIGKTNLHELAAGITTVSSLGGQTRNPYDPDRNPGGSSGGTGAGVAASYAAVGWGSDTCGSIRIPASVHNLFGLRPTKGLSSIDGILPLSTTQDTGGPLARSVTDLAIALDATVGADPADPATSILSGRTLPSFLESLDAGALAGARIGVITEWVDGEGNGAAAPRVAEVIRAALSEMSAAGAEVVDVTVPSLDGLLPGTGMIDFDFKFDLMDYLAGVPGAPVGSLEEIIEAGLHHEALDGTFRRRNQRGSRESEERQETLAQRDVLRDAVLAFMESEGLDALAYPTMRNETAIIGEPATGSSCFLSAHTGLPAISVPAGFTERGLPVGLELMGRPLDDHRLVALAYAYESTGPKRRAPHRTPPLVEGRLPTPVTLRIAPADPASAPALPGGTADPSRDAAVAGTLTVDLPTGRMSYDLAVLGVVTADAYGVVLRRVTEDGAVVVLRLAGPGENAPQGSVDLTPRLLRELLDGELEMLVHTAAGYERLDLRVETS